MKAFLNKILLKRESSYNFEDFRLSRLLNGIALISIITTFLSEVYVLIFLDFYLEGFSFALGSILFFLLIIGLNFFKQLTISKVLMVIYINLAFVLVHFMLHNETGSYMMFFSSFAMYVAVFNSRKIIIFFSFITVSLITASIIIQTNTNYQPAIVFTQDQQLPIQIAFLLNTSFLILILTLYLRRNLIENQKRLEIAIKEKDVLLKEVHHRVKNNLQVISSLFNIQKRRLQPNQKFTQEIIEAGQSRVQSMVLIHQELYSNKNIEKINVGIYIDRLVKYLQNLYSINKLSDVEISVKTSVLELSMDKAVSIGLIINEIITNSYKHAFRSANEKKIEISFQKQKDELVLSVKDNGIGIKNNLQKSTNGIGTQLIENMIGQLKATYSIKGEKGTEYLIKFKAK